MLVRECSDCCLGITDTRTSDDEARARVAAAEVFHLEKTLSFASGVEVLLLKLRSSSTMQYCCCWFYRDLDLLQMVEFWFIREISSL